jgi:ABC-type dipeptide/oligopeptide/nickel transport system permease subunit
MSAVVTEAVLAGPVAPGRAGLIRQVIPSARPPLGRDHRVLRDPTGIAARAVLTTARSCVVFAPPSGSHWLGCDDGGIDVLSEIISGGRISLIIGFAATLIAMLDRRRRRHRVRVLRPLDRHLAYVITDTS